MIGLVGILLIRLITVSSENIQKASNHGSNHKAAVGDTYDYPRYAYDYSVHAPSTNDHKAQWETRDGDAVEGGYSLVEPDGTVRLVEYNADDHRGFNAVVKKIGTQKHLRPALNSVPVPHIKTPAYIAEPRPSPVRLSRPIVAADYPRYGSGAALLAKGVPGVVYEKSSLPWDPTSGSFGGWRPRSHRKEYATYYNTKFINGNVHRFIAGPISLLGNTLYIRKTTTTHK